MDLRQYYQKIRDTKAKIADPFPVVESCETPDGGPAGRLTEVTAALAAPDGLRDRERRRRGAAGSSPEAPGTAGPGSGPDGTATTVPTSPASTVGRGAGSPAVTGPGSIPPPMTGASPGTGASSSPPRSSP